MQMYKHFLRKKTPKIFFPDVCLRMSFCVKEMFKSHWFNLFLVTFTENTKAVTKVEKDR